MLLDDSEANVGGRARAVGLQAFQVRGIAEVRACLTTIDLFPDATRPDA